jgi:hypothetical protein
MPACARVWRARAAGAPGLAGRAEVMIDQGKAAAADQPAPDLETVEAGVTAINEALFVLPSRVGDQQRAARLQRGAQPVKDAGQCPARDVEQDGVGEHAIEAGGRQGHSQHVLLPDLTAGSRARHVDELGAAVGPDDHVAEIAEGHEIAPGAAAEIEDAVRRGPCDRSQQRLDVLSDVVVPGAVAIRGRHGAVLPDGRSADLAVRRGQVLHQAPAPTWRVRGTRVAGMSPLGTLAAPGSIPRVG